MEPERIGTVVQLHSKPGCVRPNLPNDCRPTWKTGVGIDVFRAGLTAPLGFRHVPALEVAQMVPGLRPVDGFKERARQTPLFQHRSNALDSLFTDDTLSFPNLLEFHLKHVFAGTGLENV